MPFDERFTPAVERLGRKVVEKIGDSLELLIGDHKMAVFTSEGEFVSGHDDIESAQDASHRLPPGNVVIRRDGAVLSVGVPPFNPKLAGFFDKGGGSSDLPELS